MHPIDPILTVVPDKLKTIFVYVYSSLSFLNKHMIYVYVYECLCLLDRLIYSVSNVRATEMVLPSVKVPF